VAGRLFQRILRRLGLLAYAFATLVVFAVAAYVSFGLFVRRGVTPVPDIVGVERPEATARLADHGLTLEVKTAAERYDEEVPPGAVLLQDPPAGSLVKRGSRVEAVVSLGPELVAVPDLRGKALRAAQVTMVAAGLAVGSTASIFSAAGVPGTVVEQDPPPGKRVGRSTLVKLFLCAEGRGRTYVMPDLVYRGYDEVRAFFENRGLRLGSVKFEAYEGVPSGVVLRQFPLAGHPLRQEDVISLVVATAERGA
jgi:serine/threonine-protein kinase